MPLNQERIALDESVGLSFKQFLGLLFSRAPLEAVTLFVERVGHDVDSEEETIAEDEAVWVEVLLIT